MLVSLLTKWGVTSPSIWRVLYTFECSCGSRVWFRLDECGELGSGLPGFWSGWVYRWGGVKGVAVNDRLDGYFGRQKYEAKHPRLGTDVCL